MWFLGLGLFLFTALSQKTVTAIVCGAQCAKTLTSTAGGNGSLVIVASLIADIGHHGI
jgi:hypothetical protein